MPPAPAPPPPRRSAASASAPAPAPPRAPTSSPGASSAAAVSARAVLPTPPLSRSGTPTGAATPRAAAARAATLALPALLSDLAALSAAPTALRGAQFAPTAPAPPGGVDPDLDRATTAADDNLLGAVRAGAGADLLKRDDAPVVADKWLAAMDRLLARAERAEQLRHSEDDSVSRADKVARWAGEAERGLGLAAA
ncbi:hypothetical protein JCM3770_002672 [Rhodotorula araucariae]